MKCIAKGCERDAEDGIPYCQEHLDELGDLMEKYPMISLESLTKADGKLPPK